ncbi:MAG: hypothetical protein P8Y71_13875 [Pseudolabrys sp.]
MPNAKHVLSFVQRELLGVLRIGFGLIWCINIWFDLHAQHLDHYLSGYQSAMQSGPHWLAPWLGSVIGAFQAIGPHTAAVISVVVEALIALSLLTGWWGRAGGWLGLVYSLFMFSTVTTLGAPFSLGYTDPGPWPPYIIAFVFILETQAWRGLRLGSARDVNQGASPETHGNSAVVARILFGLLWAFEAYWKWHPYFIGHFLTYLTPAAQGQPAWIAAYIDAVIAVVGVVGGAVFGVFTAIVETLIAASLLSGRALRYGLVLGALWSVGIWTTAEGWGGPYGHGFSASPMPGDIFGNAINYAYIFLFLLAVYGPWGRAAQHETSYQAQERPAHPG